MFLKWLPPSSISAWWENVMIFFTKIYESELVSAGLWKMLAERVWKLVGDWDDLEPGEKLVLTVECFMNVFRWFLTKCCTGSWCGWENWENCVENSFVEFQISSQHASLLLQRPQTWYAHDLSSHCFISHIRESSIRSTWEQRVSFEYFSCCCIRSSCRDFLM